jgi:hypothetical protein
VRKVIRLASREIFSMNFLRVRDSKILSFKSARSLLLTLCVCAARALIRPSSLEFGGVGKHDSEDRRIRSEPNINYISARILRQSKVKEYRIIDIKVGDDH